MVEAGVEIGEETISFWAYPYPPASVFPDGSITAAHVRDVDPTAAPPEIRVQSGETLFVPATERNELRRFCKRHGIPLRRRPDLWGALLELFLDAEFTVEDEERASQLLARFGISSEETRVIRQRFAPAIIAYNFESTMWDWVHLGLADLLDALSGRFAGEEHRLLPEEFAATYAWAMALADRSAAAAESIDVA